LYQTHKSGAKIVDRLTDATLAQKYFLMIMAGADIGYDETISKKLSVIAKGLGIEIKE